MTVPNIDSLSVELLRVNPVWRYISMRRGMGTELKPVINLPCKTLAGKVAGIQLGLPDGTKLWGVVGNFDVINPKMNEHFATLSIESNGRWFHLARYHDFDFEKRGPDALASFLGIPVNCVFPLTYDLSGLVVGPRENLNGAVQRDPQPRLSRAEIIAMAVP